MNGRAYDYNLGRFLSVDPFIQEPGNSQSMNPYSYIMNNPLAGIDPSGYVSVGNLGITDEFCASYKCAVVDKVLAGFTMAGENGASLSQKRDAAKEAKNRSIIGQIESQGGKAFAQYWSGGKIKAGELAYVHAAVSAGTDLSRRSDRYRFASNDDDAVMRESAQSNKGLSDIDAERLDSCVADSSCVGINYNREDNGNNINYITTKTAAMRISSVEEPNLDDWQVSQILFNPGDTASFESGNEIMLSFIGSAGPLPTQSSPVNVDSYPIDRNGNLLINKRGHRDYSRGYFAPLTGANKGESYFVFKATEPHIYGQVWDVNIPRHQSGHDNNRGYTVKVWEKK